MARKPTNPPAALENKGERARLMNDPLDWINAPAESAVPVATQKPPAPKPKAPPAVPTQNRTIAMTDAKVSPSQAWDNMHTFQVLDLLSNPMMVADSDFVIRYVNEAAFKMFEQIESAIQHDLPHFRARDVIGKNIDVFHKNPAYQRHLMDGMSKPHDGKFSIGGAHLGFRATPKNTADGAVACIFVEWRDRTAEVHAQEELAQMVAAVREMSTAHMQGEIDVRIDASQFSAELGETMTMVNSMVQEHIDTKKKVVAAVSAMASGNLDAPLERFNRKRAFLNDAVEAIRGSLKSFEAENGRLLGDMKKMSSAHAAGDIEYYIDPNGYSPNYVSVVVGVNDMVQDHVATMRKIVACTSEFASGNFSAVLEQLPGKKVFINEGMEAVRANFKALVRDVGKMAQDLADGVLESSVNAAAHQGEFRNLINTIDTIRANFGKVTTEIERLSRSIVDGALDVTTAASEYKGAYRQIIEAFEQSFQSLNGVFGLIGQQVQQVAITVEQMSQASQSLATNSQIQSSSVDEVSASAEQTDVQVKSNAVSAATASQLVTGASEVAEGGKTKINEMVAAMEGIRASSQDIAKIIKVIDEIAFQTNLLALNAAVEAARAGQHGRGFAVVAQEVRNLAGRSAKAARETSDLIEDAATRVQAGVKIADETSRAFVSIADDIEQVKTLVRDIATASDEQARGVAQINLAVGEVAKSALATSQQAEELAASAAEMQAATQSMLAEVGRFRLRKPDVQTRLPDLQLAGLPAELMAQIQAMIAGQQTGGSDNQQFGSSNRDVRGYGGF